MTRSTILTRAARSAAGTLALTVVATTSAGAQDTTPRTSPWELRVSSGAFRATGDQRNQLKDGDLTAAQLSWVVNPRLAVTGTFAWARSRDLLTTGTPKLDVFTSDIGAEVRSTEWFSGGPVSLSTFVGLGAGARSYNYRNLDVAATNNLAGYGSIGGEIGMGRVALRLEARDYAAGFKPLVGAGKSEVRNDVLLMAALRFNRRPSSP
jgi:hypothetical protein